MRLPSDRRHVVLSSEEDAIGIRLRDVIGSMMWGWDYPHSDVSQSRKILAGVPDDERPIRRWQHRRVYNFDGARLTVPA